MHFFIFLLSLFGLSNPQVLINKPGQFAFADEGGELQCRSQIDASGHIVVLLENLKSNTSFKLLDVYSNKNDYFVRIIHHVKKDPNGLRANEFFREVSIPINPVSVNEITLTGNPLFESSKIDILGVPTE